MTQHIPRNATSGPKAEIDHDQVVAAFQKRWRDECGIREALGFDAPSDSEKTIAARLYVQGWFDGKTDYSEVNK